MGKFYELFEMDAHTAVETLGLSYMKVGSWGQLGAAGGGWGGLGVPVNREHRPQQGPLPLGSAACEHLRCVWNNTRLAVFLPLRRARSRMPVSPRRPTTRWRSGWRVRATRCVVLLSSSLNLKEEKKRTGPKVGATDRGHSLHAA